MKINYIKNATPKLFGVSSRKKQGFTLIELLVVIAIISLLSTVVLASLGTARGKGKDAKRVAGLKQVQIALEMYYDDFGRYPDNVSGSGNFNEDCWECDNAFFQDLNKLVAIDPYLNTRPADPSTIPAGSFWGFWYKTSGSGQDYLIAITGTSESFGTVPVSMQNTTFYLGTNSISISTPAASNWSLFTDTSGF